MPNILVKLPMGSFSGASRGLLVNKINDAAAAAEQIPNEPRKRMLCWVVMDEIDAGGFTCGGIDLTSQMLPCVAIVYVPSGVLDATSRATYTKLMHEAFKTALPADERRTLMTSVVLHEVPDGAWSANGAIWKLADFAGAAGFAHLRHLVV
jgi:phenylpyruvate tautomerase PptA (4-oxalocrotonate tautomerase family)